MKESHSYPLVYPPPPISKPPARVRKWKPKGPFPFFRLPPEIRFQILQHCLTLPPTHIVDYDPTNPRQVRKRLEIFLASKRMHEEAYPIFYSTNTFRLFPTHRDFAKIPDIILTRLPTHYRAAITNIELRLGPGWADPPANWTLGYGRSRDPRRKKDKSGLEDCTALRRLSVFAEVDPSHPVFEGFRISEEFYTQFCGELLKRALAMAPVLETISFDAFESVGWGAPLMRELVGQAEAAEKRVVYGPERGWQDEAVRSTDVTDDEALTAKMAPGSATATIQALGTAVAAISLQA